jgi:quercetin dioxygenase-like cupin family protein
MDDASAPQRFEIFRAKDAPGLMEAGCMTLEPFSPVQRAGMDTAIAAGLLHGDEVRVLCNIPGFSLAHVWFKKDYPLPLHSHDTDCLYYIIAGSLRMGTEDLGPRDSFFIPAGVPYTYRPGPDGVELLEFRHATSFNFLNHAKGEAFWKKAAETVAANVEDWKAAVPPTVMA